MAPPSLIHFQEVPSNTAKCQLQEEAGQLTSPAHCPSAQSHTQKEEEQPLVSHIVTVVTFPALELVTHAIPFQVAPVHPVSHLGIPKLNTAAEVDPELLTVAEHQASKVVVVPTQIVAAAHGHPVSHFAPLGIVKFKTASKQVPELVTQAQVQASQVVVVPIVTVAAVPGSQVSHLHP